MSNTIEIIDRDYVDNFSIKDLAINNIMPKYFDEEISNITVGLTGVVTEYLGIITEDSFNASSTMILECFPTRAKMSTSIHSNAALFQLSNAFVEASRCPFLILLPTKDIENNFITKDNISDINYFYIDKDTIFYVEDIPFVLDYDIEIRARKRNGKYVYSAKYLMNNGYVNSVSLLTDPYIKTRHSSNGYLALQVDLRQYLRYTTYEQLTDISNLSYTTINVNFNDGLAGIDVFYKAPGESEYVQLNKKVIYSLPEKTPFFYYSMKDDNTLQISFTTKDGYFQPEFNSELMIITYNSLADKGNFDIYEGDDITILKNTENYDYSNSWLITAKPTAGSTGGSERLSNEGLQQLTVESYSTANAITTIPDLTTYFKNYKYRYGNEVLFLKKRDDAVERLFSAFMYIKKNDYFYPTNTLTMDTNIQNLEYMGEEYKEGDYYIMDPGFLFSYKNQTVFENKEYGYYYKPVHGGNTYKKYSLKDDTDMGEEISLVKLYEYVSDGLLTYGKRNLNSNYIDFIFDEEKETEAYREYLSIFNNKIDVKTGNRYKKISSTIYEKLDISNGISTHVSSSEVPSNVLIMFGKNNSGSDYTIADYVFDYTFEDYKKDMNIDNRCNIYNTDIEKLEHGKKYDFMFTNNLLMVIRKDNGIINYYSTYISQDSLVDFVSQNDDSIIQFITYTLRLRREIEEKRRYNISLTFLPSISSDTNDYDILDYELLYRINSENVTELMDEIPKSGYYKTIYNDSEKITGYEYYTINNVRKSEYDLIGADNIEKFSDYLMADVFRVSKRYNTCVLDPDNENYVSERFLDGSVEKSLSTYDMSNLDRNSLRVILSFYDGPDSNSRLLGYMEMIPTDVNTSKDQITFESELYVDDYIMQDSRMRLVNFCPHCGSYSTSFHPENETDEHQIYVCNKCGKTFEPMFHNVTKDDMLAIGIEDIDLRVTVLYKDKPIDESDDIFEYKTDNEFVTYDSRYRDYVWTNKYETLSDSISFLNIMDMVRSNIIYKDYYQNGVNALDCYIYDMNLLKYSILAYKERPDRVIDPLLSDDIAKFDDFMDLFMNYYQYLSEAKLTLRNATNINVEFYNTYGRSTNFIIGEDNEIIDTINISVLFDVWLKAGTDIINAENELKAFIKEYIESINEDGTNSLYISNLITELEKNFAYVHHLRFNGINNYDTTYQTIKNNAISLEDLSRDQRRYFVPDLLVINTNNIYLTFYEI